jgi:hypothetical protein
MATKTATKKATPKNRIAGNGKGPAIVPKSTEKIALRPIDTATFNLPIIGTSELIVNKFSNKALQQIEDKQGKVAKGGRLKREPREEYLAAFYVMSGKPDTKGAKYGIPAAGFKNAMVTAATRFVDGLQGTVVRGALFVLDNDGGLVELTVSKPYMRTDTIRLPNGNLDLRYRPAFEKWSCVLKIHYNRSILSAEQIVNLASQAGFGVGVCEWRPERNGAYGMFEVDQKKLKIG